MLQGTPDYILRTAAGHGRRPRTDGLRERQSRTGLPAR